MQKRGSRVPNITGVLLFSNLMTMLLLHRVTNCPKYSTLIIAPMNSYISERTLKVASDAIARMTEMRESGALAFVGSGFSCKAEALVAEAWNMPMIAFVSASRVVGTCCSVAVGPVMLNQYYLW